MGIRKIKRVAKANVKSFLEAAPLEPMREPRVLSEGNPLPPRASTSVGEEWDWILLFVY